MKELLIDTVKSSLLSELFIRTIEDFVTNNKEFLDVCIERLSDKFMINALYSVDSITVLEKLAIIGVNTNAGKFTFRFNKRPGGIIDFDIQETTKSQFYINVATMVSD